MRYRKLTAAGDYRFGQNANDFLVNSPATVAQAILTALLLHQGEWFLDVTVGMPWESQVLGYNTKSLYDSAIKGQILLVQGVTSITSYSSALDPTNRKLTVNATVNTIFGPVTIQPAFGLGLGYGGGATGGYGITPYGGA